VSERLERASDDRGSSGDPGVLPHPLGAERDASHHTIDSYRHTFRLLLAFAKTHTGKDPCELDLADLDAGS